MTINTGTGFTQFGSDSGTADIIGSKPNITFAGAGGVTTSATANTVTITGTTMPSEGFINLGFDYNAGTGVFSITGSDGTALAGGNPGFVSFNSQASPGQIVTISITANQTFIDSNGTSEIVDNLFGLDTGDTWGTNDMPFFIYAVLNDAENAVAFMISRMPWMPKSPVSTEIGEPSTAQADEQYSFFSFDDITETLFDENPLQYIGCIRMRFTQPGAADDWTVQALTEEDGPGKDYNNTMFDYPVNVNGAAAASHFTPAGGTAPAFSNNNFKYKITRDGTFEGYVNDQNATVQGTGAVQANISVPYQAWSTSSPYGAPVVATGHTQDATANLKYWIFVRIFGTNKTMGLGVINLTLATFDLQYDDLFSGTGANRLVTCKVSYKVATNFND